MIDSRAQEAGASAPAPEGFLGVRRDGTLAAYPHGTGPFFSNRSQRRDFTGTEGRHDGSKKPTKGRRARSSWRGN